MNSRILTMLLLLTGICLPGFSAAQEPDLAVEQIPPSLLKEALAVTRYSNTSILVSDSRGMTLQVKKAITVLSPQGSDYGVAYVFYDKSRKITSLKAGIYNAAGKLIRLVKEKEFTDQSAISDFSIFEDNRMKYYRPSVREYPYTIVYEYEIRRSDTHYFPDWFPAASPLMSVQDAHYEITCGDGFDLRVREMHTSPGTVARDDKGNTVYRWNVHDLPALGEEPFAPPLRSYLPHVLAAPVNFQYEGMKGNFTSWEAYGQWVYAHLIEGRDELPSSTIADIQQLVSGAKDDREKVARIYRFMQEKNRYVSVQVGIGGLQPMTAGEVDRLSYGDCKGLVNYTKALLAAVGIPSIYTEVAAGDEQRSYITDFASFGQGNHIILCVPLKGDTVWLECTSKETPVNYLGTFTADRNVLLIMPEGGKIIRTPAVQNSRSLRNATFTLQDNGEASVTVQTDFTGVLYNERHQLSHASPRKAEELLRELYPLPDLYVEEWKVSHPLEATPLTREDLRLRARDLGNSSGGRVFLPLNPLNRLEHLPARLSERETDIWIPESYTEEDRFEFRLSGTYAAEYLPESMEIVKPFGQFRMNASMEEGILVYRRLLQLHKGLYPGEDYEEVSEFFRQVQQADYQKAVLVKP